MRPSPSVALPEGPAEPRPISVGDALIRIWQGLRDTWRQLRAHMSFWTIVGAAAVLSTVYYFVFAESLYDSKVIITIQNKSPITSGSVLGGMFGSVAGSSQTQQLYEYIESMDMLKILDRKYHLRQLYSSPSRNPFWRLWSPDRDDRFLDFYQNMMEIEPDTTNSIISIDVLDYDPHRAQSIASDIVAQSQQFMNQQSSIMQAQTMRYAQTELENSVKAVQAAKLPQEHTVAELRLTAAQQGLATATGVANQQQIFVIPISVASLPTDTTRPERLLDIAAITLITAISYLVGFLMWANVRDHRNA
jgi:capsule polysaccharide export protein KpsE/RkpR